MEDVSHIVIGPYQETAFDNVGRDALAAARLADHTTFIGEPSSTALARLTADGVVVDAAFVDGSHRFHEVFVDLYFLRKLVRPGGLIILDDADWRSVATAVRYFDLKLGWRRTAIETAVSAAPASPATDSNRPFTTRTHRVLALAQQNAAALGDTAVGAEHLLVGVLQKPGVGGQLLGRHGLAVDAVLAALRH